MRKKITLLILSVALLLASVSSSWGYALLRVHGTEGEILKWKGQSPEVLYRVNMSGHSLPSSVSNNDALNEILTAMATWSTVPTASFKFTYVGESNVGFGLDGMNNISWLNMGNIGVVAFNLLYATLEADILEADIVFNSYYPYHINGTSHALDLQNVAAHELGHSVPLGDLHGPEHLEKTMVGVIGWGETKKRDLHQDDIDGITFLYPASAPQPVCTYTLSHSSKEFNASGGNDSVTVTAPTGCSWNVSGNPGWITMNNVSNGIVSYSVAGNSSTSQRVATMSIAGKPFTVSQKGQTPNSNGISASVSSLDFGTAAVRTSKAQTFTVTNMSSSTVRIALSRTGPNVRDFVPTVLTRMIQPGASITVSVTFSPRAKGDRSTTLTLTPVNKPFPAISIPLTGKGI